MDSMRVSFEIALRSKLVAEGYSQESADLLFERGSDGEYRSIRISGAWWGWQQGQTVVLSGCEIPMLGLVAGALRNIEATNKHPVPRWSLVRDTFGNGSGVSAALCRMFGYDPEEYLSSDPNYAVDQKVLCHLRGIQGSTSWVISGELKMDQNEVKKSLYRLKRKGLAETASSKTFWKVI